MDRLDKRQAIIEAARERFRYYGVRKTTMQEIAEDMGIAVGTLYLYFKNKDDLIIGCAEEFTAKHKQFSEELIRSDLLPDEKLRRYILNRFRAMEEIRMGSSHAAEIARAAMKLQPERFREDDERLFRTVLDILEEGIRQGVYFIADPSRDAKVCVQAITYFLPIAGLEPYRTPTEAKLLDTLDWFINNWKTPMPQTRESTESRKKARVEALKEDRRRLQELNAERKSKRPVRD